MPWRWLLCVRDAVRVEEGAHVLGEVGMQPDVTVVLGFVEPGEGVKERAGGQLTIDCAPRFALCYRVSVHSKRCKAVLASLTELQHGVPSID